MFFHGDIYYFLYILFLYNRANYVGALINSDSAAIEHKVIILASSPLSHSKRAVENLTSDVLIVKSVFYLDFGLTVVLKHVTRTEIHVRTYEYVKTILSLSQNVVGTASHYDAITLLGKLFDEIHLRDLHAICKRKSTVIISARVDRYRIKKAVFMRCVFVVSLNNLARKSRVIDYLIYDLGIVKGISELFRHHSSDSSSAAAKLTAYSHDFLHRLASFRNLFEFMDKFYHKTCILSIFEFSVEKIFLSFSVNAHHFEPKDVVKGDLIPISVVRIKLTPCITLVIIFSGFADTNTRG